MGTCYQIAYEWDLSSQLVQTHINYDELHVVISIRLPALHKNLPTEFRIVPLGNLLCMPNGIKKKLNLINIKITASLTFSIANISQTRQLCNAFLLSLAANFSFNSRWTSLLLFPLLLFSGWAISHSCKITQLQFAHKWLFLNYRLLSLCFLI